MGAAVITMDTDPYSPVDANAGYQARATAHLSASYATGGDSVTPAQFGLGRIVKMVCAPAGGYVFRYNSASGTIQAYYTGTAANDPLNEVTPTTDLHTTTFDVIAWG